MNLADYFNPSDALPNPYGLSKESSLYGRLTNTAKPESSTIGLGSLVIFGVLESRNSHNPGASLAPDHIRSHLYALSGAPIKKGLIDLGNLKQTDSPADTYMAVRDVLSFLLSKGATAILLGGTQELTWSAYQALLEHFGPINLSIVDSSIDMGQGDGDFSSTCYVDRLMEQKPDELFDLNLIGYQGYLTNGDHIQMLQDRGHSLYRLGFVRGAMSEVEPAIRDSHMISFDLGSVRQSDSPGSVYPSPNGLYAEEVCQLARYAGNSERVKVCGVFELNTINDAFHQSGHLAAQLIWHFMESFYQRQNGKGHPTTSEGLKKFYVSSPIPNLSLVFLHNPINDTWWIEIPGAENRPSHIMACSYSDYKKASKGDPPERWVQAVKKVSGLHSSA